MNKVETRIFIALQVVMIVVLAVIAVQLIGPSGTSGFLSGAVGAKESFDVDIITSLLEDKAATEAEIKALYDDIRARNKEIENLTGIIVQMQMDGAAQEELDVFYAQLDSLDYQNQLAMLELQFLIDKYQEYVMLLSMYYERYEKAFNEAVSYYESSSADGVE
jgi:hypothetical protein